MSRLPSGFLDLLACPVADCRGPLREDGNRLVCGTCGRRYPFEGDWPVLIPEEAERPDAGAEA